MNEVKVKIKNVEGLELPTYKKEGDAGLDICSVEDVTVFPGNTVKVRTNLFVELPDGYAFEVSPRSGLSANTKLRVILGTVDSGYRGEIGVIIDNISQGSLTKLIPESSLDPECDYIEVQEGYYIEVRNTGDIDPDFHGAYEIHKGDRIAQLKLKVVPKCVWEVVDELSESDRGTGGFGHTGVLEGDEGWDPEDFDEDDYNSESTDDFEDEDPEFESDKK